MRSIWNGNVEFGLITFPIRIFPVAEKNDVKFNYLHKQCGTPIKYEKRCPKCDIAVGQSEIITGYEYEKDRYLVINPEDLDPMESDKSKISKVISFIDLKEIDPVYFEKAYYLSPRQYGEKPYCLLLDSMVKTGTAALCRLTLRQKPSLGIIFPLDDILALCLIHYADEVRDASNLIEGPSIEPKSKEIDMAVNLIKNLAADFDIHKYSNDYRTSLLGLIHERTANKQISETDENAGKVVDLTEALRKSIDMTKRQKKA